MLMSESGRQCDAYKNSMDAAVQRPTRPLLELHAQLLLQNVGAPAFLWLWLPGSAAFWNLSINDVIFY